MLAKLFEDSFSCQYLHILASHGFMRWSIPTAYGKYSSLSRQVFDNSEIQCANTELNIFVCALSQSALWAL